jgi:hypothetical protein
LEESGDRPDRRPLGDQASLVLSVVLASALVVALVVGVLLSVQYAQRDSSVVPLATAGAGEEDPQQVQDAVGLFAANLNSYSVRDIGDYRSRIAPLLTDGFRSSFDLAVDNTIAMVKSTRMTSRGEVLSTAVTSLDARTATALVVADAEVTSDIGDRQRHFRWKVSLVKQGDTWLVDNFTPVA